MALCPFNERECTSDCRAYSTKRRESCLVLYRLDRTNMLLNFIDKKLSDKNS